MCARYKWDGTLYKEKVNSHHNKLEVLQKNIPESIMKRLKRLYSIGTYGDPVMNPECLDIYKWARDINPNIKLEMHSNGGARDEKFWRALAELGVRVWFGIDGLDDTNHLYRRNVKWDRLMSNVKAFIGAGGKAIWTFLIFKHNEHQVDSARSMSQNLGFHNFNSSFSQRWVQSNWKTGETKDVSKWRAGDHDIEKPTGQLKDPVKSFGHTDVYETAKFNYTDKITCWAATDQRFEIYIRADGTVQPCCMLGDLDVHEARRLISDIKAVNINHTPLTEILQGDFFRLLDRGINQGSEHRLQNCFYTCRLKK